MIRISTAAIPGQYLLSALFMACMSLTSCSLLPPGTSTITEAPAAEPLHAAGASATPADSSDSVPPDNSLPEHRVKPFPEDTLLALLTAEFAGQRQQYGLALATYMQEARSTGDPDISERAAQIAQFTGTSQQADEASRLWIANDPSSPDAHMARARLLTSKRQYQEALKEYVITHELTGESSYEALAASASIHPDPGSATLLEDFQALTATYPLDPGLWTAIGILEQGNDHNDRALDYFNKALAIDPAALAPSVFKARLLASENRREEALAWVNQVLMTYPDNKTVQVLQARLLLGLERMDEAATAFARLVSQYPDDSTLLLSLGLIEYDLKRDQAAEEHLRELTERGEHLPQAYYYRALIAERAEEFDKAFELFASVQGGREFMAAQSSAARILYITRGLDQTISFLNVVIRHHPAQASDLAALQADFYMQDKRPEAALQIYDQALEQKPDSKNLLFGRAMLLGEQNDLFGLERDLRHLLSLDPDNAEALNALGYTLLDRTNRLDDARVLIEKAYQLNPQSPAIIDSLGWYYFRTGELTRAEPLLKQAYDLSSDHEIAAHYGELLWALGRNHEAMGIWKQGLDDHPDSQLIHDTMQRLDVRDSNH